MQMYYINVETSHTSFGTPITDMQKFFNSHQYVGRRYHEIIANECVFALARYHLKGGDFWRGHAELQTTLNDITRNEGFSIKPNLPNMFHRRILSPVLENYLNIHLH